MPEEPFFSSRYLSPRSSGVVPDFIGFTEGKKDKTKEFGDILDKKT
jgi:hypothetical protein